MCQRVTCGSCGKATYTGCGRHVEQVLGGVPGSKRCHCEPERQARGRFRRLFTRG